MKLLQTAKKYYEGLITLIYPDFCVVCGAELSSQEEHLCFSCYQDLQFTYFEKYKESTHSDEVFWGRVNVERVYSMLYYDKGLSTQKVLHQIKYKGGKELGRYMGKMMAERIKTIEEFTDVDAIIPVPLHSKKEFLRGYNQSLMIAEGINQVLEIPIVEAVYRRTHDESQTKKNQEQRYVNAQGRFALKENGLTGLKHVVVVDDVLTTGATLEFVCRVILENPEPIKISLATIAVAHG